MGFFWSMIPLSIEQQDARLVIKDVKKPLVVNFAVFPDHIVPTESTVSTTKASVRPLCIATATRLILAPGVERIEVNVGRVRGTLFIPQGKCCSCLYGEGLIFLHDFYIISTLITLSDIKIRSLQDKSHLKLILQKRTFFFWY